MSPIKSEIKILQVTVKIYLSFIRAYPSSKILGTKIVDLTMQIWFPWWCSIKTVPVYLANFKQNGSNVTILYMRTNDILNSEINKDILTDNFINIACNVLGLV